MPFVNINQCNYYYEISGSGEETIVLAHGLLWNRRLFYKQIAYLKNRYRIVAYDHRGQGRSEVTQHGYDMDTLYQDAVALIEALNLGSVHFGGLSMGGFVGMRLAARRPDLVKSLILMNTSAEAEANTLKYQVLNTIVRLFGVPIVTDPVMKIMFGPAFLQEARWKEERDEWRDELQSNEKTIVNAVAGVLSRKSVVEELAAIRCPTLIITGSVDKATPPAKGAFIQSRIPGSQLINVPGAGHTGTISESGIRLIASGCENHPK